MIVDGEGQLVWFKPLSDAESPSRRAFNVRVQSYRGEPVLTWWQGAVVGAHGVGHYELYDSRYRLIGRVYAGNGYQGDLHEFVLTDAGTALFTCYGQAIGKLPRGSGEGGSRGQYLYGVVQEVDVATGAVLFQWRSDDHIGFEESYHRPPSDPAVAWDYFHVNSIAVDPTDGHLLISGRNTWTCYKVDRQTGEVIWRLGGKHSDFAMAAGTRFAFQHHVTRRADGIVTIFDNEAGPPREAGQSRGLVVAIDEQSRQVSLVRQYLHEPAVLSPALGSVQQLDHGSFIGWGDSSYFTQYDDAGAVLLDAHLAPGTLSYRAFESAWAGRPATEPTIAVIPTASGSNLYASWNGATEHTRWRVLGGQHPERLDELSTERVAGFETQIELERPPAWLAVEALDSEGRTVGRSTAQPR